MLSSTEYSKPEQAYRHCGALLRPGIWGGQRLCRSKVRESLLRAGWISGKRGGCVQRYVEDWNCVEFSESQRSFRECSVFGHLAKQMADCSLWDASPILLLTKPLAAIWYTAFTFLHRKRLWGRLSFGRMMVAAGALHFQGFWCSVPCPLTTWGGGPAEGDLRFGLSFRGSSFWLNFGLFSHHFVPDCWMEGNRWWSETRMGTWSLHTIAFPGRPKSNTSNSHLRAAFQTSDDSSYNILSGLECKYLSRPLC